MPQGLSPQDRLSFIQEQLEQEEIQLVDNTKLFTYKQLENFFYIAFFMGLVKLPRAEDHWNRKSPFHPPSVIRPLMSRKRFKSILKFLHYDEDSVIQMIEKNSNNHYIPSLRLSIDEYMAPYKGLVRFKQYEPDKPHKFGLKYFVLSDSNGFILTQWLYRGSDESTTKSVTIDPSVVSSFPPNSPLKIPIEFAEWVRQKVATDDRPLSHYLFAMDNYYTSLQVATVLSNFSQNINSNNDDNNPNNKIHYVMTVRSIRPTYLFKDGLGRMVQKDNKKKLAAIAFPKEDSGIPQDICATAINDSKVTYFLSNACNPYTLKEGKLTKLDVQTQYNATTHGVDLSGQLSSNCRSYPHRKSKYTHVNIFAQLDRAIVNAYCIFKSLEGNSTYRFCDFTQNVVRDKLGLQEPIQKQLEHLNPITSKVFQDQRDRIKQLEQELATQSTYVTSGNGGQYAPTSAAAPQTVVHALVQGDLNPCQYCKVLDVKRRTRTTKTCCQCKVNFHDECYLIAHLPENKLLLSAIVHQHQQQRQG
ncbi:hypothetical protein DFA_05162 [Cavenderia fasciculata]|uniref:PiggyBac transposable element-derived protein domain-containing protein n=1 Tax=Cavenderia fasciculata TaxID=261658 RepID=F4PNH9_CACFS|nr:uncharacterized protein DFA_05162 [Cavenderia fasciculata]EGG23032.1 hypothetical protein DFA_05162 [Cavenderia fasciculata]|eukprot:XP_004360883.1 hypothetical protein DFA_05162 [Cavenderia fasciculata]